MAAPEDDPDDDSRFDDNEPIQNMVDKKRDAEGDKISDMDEDSIAPACLPSPKPSSPRSQTKAAPPKKKSPQTKSPQARTVDAEFYSFDMKNGMPPTHIHGTTSANKFMSTYKDIIIRVRPFKTKTRWENYKKTSALAFAEGATKAAASPNNSTDTDAAIADRVVQLIVKNQDTDSIVGLYHTDCFSNLCAVLITVKDYFGGIPWCWKPDMLVEIYKRYAETVNIENPIMAEALKNISFGSASNPESSDKNVPWVKTFTNANNQLRRSPYYVIYTYITIPVASLDSAQAEQEWIVTSVGNLLRGIRDLMQKNVFYEMLKRYDDLKQGRFVSMIYDTKKKTNLPRFLANAKFKVEPIDNLADKVTNAVALDIMTKLFSDKSEVPKYMGDPFAQPEDD